MPFAHRKFDLSGLQCPFTWKCGYLPMDFCVDKLDKLCLVPSAWAGVVERYKLAWSLWENEQHAHARTLIAECYMRLLPWPTFNQDCGLVNDYRRALRVLLDSMWAMMGIPFLADVAGMDYMTKFIAAVEPLARLDDKQRAAVYAVRGAMYSPDNEDRKWFRKAIALSPGEGEWRHMLGWVLQDARACRGTPSKEEVSLLRAAYKHRKHPDTLLRLARTLAECGPPCFAEAEALVSEALALFPNHPRALTNTANILTLLRGFNPESVAEMRELYERAQVAAGERAFIHLKLGSLCHLDGDEAQSKHHYDAGMRLNPSACRQYLTTCAALTDHGQ